MRHNDTNFLFVCLSTSIVDPNEISEAAESSIRSQELRAYMIENDGETISHYLTVPLDSQPQQGLVIASDLY